MPSVAQTEYGIRDVWAVHLEEEFRNIRQIVQKYKYVAMDTEFPGVVARPIGEFRSTTDYQYQLLRWKTCMPKESIDLLRKSGIQFEKHEQDGIDVGDFAELLMTSGVVLVDEIKWLSFHSGFDFGYLLKILTNSNLPMEESEFFELLRLYFANIYDIKYLMKSCKNLKGGLQEVADQLEIQRVGPQHQAGSDSLLTGSSFFKMREMFFEDNIDDAKYCGHLYGVGTSYVQNGTSTFENNSYNSTPNSHSTPVSSAEDSGGP